MRWLVGEKKDAKSLLDKSKPCAAHECGGLHSGRCMRGPDLCSHDLAVPGIIVRQFVDYTNQN